MMRMQCDNELCARVIQEGQPYVELTYVNDSPTFSDAKTPKQFCHEDCLKEWVRERYEGH